MRLRGLWGATLASLLVASAGRADWPAGGEKLMDVTNSFNGIRRVFFLEHPSGDLVVIGVGHGNATHIVTTQRVSTTGNLDPSWPALGTAFAGGSAPYDGYSEYTGFAVDDSGNVRHSWASRGSFAGPPLGNQTELITPSGELSARWLASTQGDNQASDLCTLPGGDVLVMCGALRLQRVTRAGTVAAGWPALGVAVLPAAGLDYDCELVGDGAGGAIVYSRGMQGPPRVTRYDGNAARHAGWAAAGLSLSSPATSEFTGDDLLDNLLPSGADHLLAVWTRGEVDAGFSPNGKASILVQRFGLDGTLDPGWPTAGLPAVAADTIACASAISDGLGGVYLVWEAHHQPHVNHVLADGSLVGGTGGVSFLDAGAVYEPLFHIFPGGAEGMVADKLPGGGLLVGWNDARLSPVVSFRLRWLRADLSPDPDRPGAGLAVFPASTAPFEGSLRAIHSDSAGGAFVAWADAHGPIGAEVGEVWMTHVAAAVNVGVAPPMTGPSTLHLSAPRPNPAHDALSLRIMLPDDSPAQLRLFDLAGRELRSVEVRGAGEETARIDGLAALPPGLYLARLSHRSGERSVRVVLTK